MKYSKIARKAWYVVREMEDKLTLYATDKVRNTAGTEMWEEMVLTMIAAKLQVFPEDITYAIESLFEETLSTKEIINRLLKMKEWEF